MPVTRAATNIRAYRRLFPKNRTGTLLVRRNDIEGVGIDADLAVLSDRLLMPCFSTANIYNMFDGMMDVVSQLVLKWER